MRNILLTLGVLSFSVAQAQFSVNVQLPTDMEVTESYLFTYDGSKDVLAAKGTVKDNKLIFNHSKSYNGMMRIVFFPNNNSLNLASENKNVDIVLGALNGKNLGGVTFKDEVNKTLNDAQLFLKKKESIYPALLQIKEYYKPNEAFSMALDKEIEVLSNSSFDASKHPFLKYYLETTKEFISGPDVKSKTTVDYITFFQKTGSMLETSSLLKPILISYLNAANRDNLMGDVDKLLKEVNLETPRGQTILSELIEIFESYNMVDLKTKYLAEAKGLKCAINDRLTGTIKSNDDVAVGSKFKNNVFLNGINNAKAKSIYDIKADKKIIMFWSSSCSHCVTEMPKLLEKYAQLKSKGVEVIGLSLDSDINAYKDMANKYPWVNASEGKGWYSSYSKDYNIHATPSFFILDSNNLIINKPDHIQNIIEYFELK